MPRTHRYTRSGTINIIAKPEHPFQLGILNRSTLRFFAFAHGQLSQRNARFVNTLQNGFCQIPAHVKKGTDTLYSYPADLMEAYPVTRQVNQPGFDGPECVDRIVPKQGDLGLF